MPIRTNNLSAAARGADADSTRIMIVRRPMGWVKQGKCYDEPMQELSPSDELLTWWNGCEQTDEDWTTYKNRFLKEMENADGVKSIDSLAKRVMEGRKDITLLCHCGPKKEGPNKHCHKHIVKALIENTIEELRKRAAAADILHDSEMAKFD